MKIQPLNKVDVTHRNVRDPGVIWLLNNGYRLRYVRGRVFLVRKLPLLRLLR